MTGVAVIIEGKNDQFIYRNESGDRRGDRLDDVDCGRNGPRLATRFNERGFARRRLDSNRVSEALYAISPELLRGRPAAAGRLLRSLALAAQFSLPAEDCRSATECYPILIVASRRAASFQIICVSTVSRFDA